NIVLNPGTALTFGRTNAGLTLANNISGSGTVTENGAGGTTALSGTNTYSGATGITAGTLQFNGSAAMSGNSALTLTTGSTLALRSDSNATFTPASIATSVNGSTITADQITSGG